MSLMHGREHVDTALRLVRANPTGFTSMEFAQSCGISRQAAYERLTKLIDEGWLKTAGTGKATVYRAAPYGRQHPWVRAQEGAAALERPVAYAPSIRRRTSEKGGSHMTRHEYTPFSHSDRTVLASLIQEREEQGWELFTITESWAAWVDSPQPNSGPHLFTAWMRRPR